MYLIISLDYQPSRIKSIYRYSAAVVMEMDYGAIDINQCPPGSGNELPNHFASTAQCNETTELVSMSFRVPTYKTY